MGVIPVFPCLFGKLQVTFVIPGADALPLVREAAIQAILESALSDHSGCSRIRQENLIILSLVIAMAFPVNRLRRLRRTAELRNLVCETRLTPQEFVYPMFVCPGEGIRKEVSSMPGVFNLSVDEAVSEAQQVRSVGVPSVILFGLPDKKDEVAT